MSTVTMQELELESAELLPARETLNRCGCGPSGGGGGFLNHDNILSGNVVQVQLFGVQQASTYSVA